MKNPRTPAALVTIGVLATLVGLVDGIVIWARKREVNCPDGTFFPEGTTDYRCFEHPGAEQGIAVVSISLALGILLVLIGMLIAHLVPRAADGPSD